MIDSSISILDPNNDMINITNNNNNNYINKIDKKKKILINFILDQKEKKYSKNKLKMLVS